MDSTYSLTWLSKKFNVSQTALKECFKCLFGKPIATYVRDLKMQKAAILLKTTNNTITQIAGSVGYDNASKFSEAFRNLLEKNPSKYRVQEILK